MIDRELEDIFKLLKEHYFVILTIESSKNFFKKRLQNDRLPNILIIWTQNDYTLTVESKRYQELAGMHDLVDGWINSVTVKQGMSQVTQSGSSTRVQGALKDSAHNHRNEDIGFGQRAIIKAKISK